MSDIPSLIRKLQDPNPNARFDACEQLRVAPIIPDDAIAALRLAARDANKDVAESAKSALAVHAPGALEAPTAAPRAQIPSLAPPPMPATSPNSPEYIFALERRLMIAEEEIRRLGRALQEAGDHSKLPNTAILSPSFLTRALAIWGHAFVVQLIITAAVYCVVIAAGLFLRQP